MPAVAADPRFRPLLDAFARRFGRKAALLARAPGRVNLIGEHTDYNGLPVLPMAIDREVLIAAGPRDDRIVRLGNTAAFPDRTYAIGDVIAPYPGGDWGNYSKAAAQGLGRHFGAPLPRGADLLIDGSIPTGAGLSSSSALVVANALALLACNEIEVPYPTLAEILPGAERYVGTLSGGMDQTISLLAVEGHALRIDFFPLRYRPVPLPENGRIVVCDSLVPAEKSAGARQVYNQRVVECTLGCRILDSALGHSRNVRRLGDLASSFPGRGYDTFLSALTAVLPNHPLSRRELTAIAGIESTDVDRIIGDSGAAEPFTISERVRHVLTEAERVGRAEAALSAGDVATFGSLMNESHESCRVDYQISSPPLDDLVEAARRNGALGARLTGAGFGGCTVNLLPAAAVDDFLAAVDRDFYRSRQVPPDEIALHRFVLRPVGGAETSIL